MAKPNLGTKRLCAGCSAKFYDLGKTPIVCPKCGTVYEVAPPPRGRSDVPRDVPAEAAVEAVDAEFVSLEEADADSKSGKVAAVKSDVDDIDIDDDIDDDDDDSTFIPDEEEGDEDVTDIIGDVDKDDET